MAIAERDFQITKQVDAPVDDVFRAFTDADELTRWWGPEHFHVSDVISDARPAGVFSLVMSGPDGVGQPVAGTYQEVSAPSHLVADISAISADGSPLVTATLTVDLTPAGAATTIHLSAHGTAFTSEARGMLDGMQEGWTSSLICLERFLEESQGSTLKARHETA